MSGDMLTAREREIWWELVTSPLNIKSLAADLGIDRDTLATHATRIYEKMGIGKAGGLDRRIALIQAYYSTVLEDVRRTQGSTAIQEEYHFQTSAAPVPSERAAAARATPPEALVASPLAAPPRPDTEPAATISARESSARKEPGRSSSQVGRAAIRVRA